MTLAAYEILCRAFGSIYWCTSIIWLIYHLHSLCTGGGSVHGLLSCNKATYFSVFVTLFFDMFRRFWADAALVCPQILCLMSAYYKTIKTAGGDLLTASESGEGWGKKIFRKKTKRKIKQRLCTGLCSAWILKVPIWSSLYRFWIRNLKWIRIAL